MLVKRAYADWSRYRDARHELQNAGLGLIEMPSAREGAKNRADIQMAVDAMELAYSREHVNNFVIVSGDSDFTPLVGKLRELNKRVIGVGNRELGERPAGRQLRRVHLLRHAWSPRAGGGSPAPPRQRRAELNPVQLLQETLTALQREGTEWPLASDRQGLDAPQVPGLRRDRPRLLDVLQVPGGRRRRPASVQLETDPRSGTYRVELGEHDRAAAGRPPTAPRRAPRRGGRGPAAAAARRPSRRAGRCRGRRGVRGRGAPSPPRPRPRPRSPRSSRCASSPTPDPDLGRAAAARRADLLRGHDHARPGP